MRKSLPLILVITLIASTSASPASAAIKPGTTCKGKGTTKISGDKTFTCVKSGKKLIWSKGVLSSPPVAQSAPAPSPLPEVIPIFPTSFNDLEANSDGIAYAVWKNTRDNLEKYPTTDLKISIFTGPKSKERYPASFTEEAIKLGSRVLGAQKQPKEVIFYQYSKIDTQWGREQAAKYVSPFNLGNLLPDQAEGLCSGIDCDGVVTNIASGIGLVLVGVSTPVDRFKIARFKGQNDLHEYTHAVQGMVFESKGGQPPAVRVPCWYAEGQPQAVSIPTVAKSYSDYVAIRKGWITDNKWLLKDYEPSTIEEFMKSGISLPCTGNVQQMIYYLGYIIIESIMAVGGIDKTFDVQTRISEGMKFEEAFKKVYDISWADASVIISKTVSKIFKENRK